MNKNEFKWVVIYDDELTTYAAKVPGGLLFKADGWAPEDDVRPSSRLFSSQLTFVPMPTEVADKFLDER